MALTALSPRRIQSVGSFTELVVGTAGGSGTSTTVTIPRAKAILSVVVGGSTSATSPFCDTISGNTFTVTTASNDLFTYIATVQGGV